MNEKKKFKIYSKPVLNQSHINKHNLGAIRMTQKDKDIVRELAKRYMELATDEKQQKMNKHYLVFTIMFKYCLMIMKSANMLLKMAN